VSPWLGLFASSSPCERVAQWLVEDVGRNWESHSDTHGPSCAAITMHNFFLIRGRLYSEPSSSWDDWDLLFSFNFNRTKAAILGLGLEFPPLMNFPGNSPNNHEFQGPLRYHCRLFIGLMWIL